MKDNFINIIISALVFSFIVTSCGKSDKKEVSIDSANNSIISESDKIQEITMSEIVVTESPETTVTSVNETTTMKSSETAVSDNSISETNEYTEKQIVDAVCTDIYGYVPDFKENSDHSEYLISKAEELSERILGEIVSEKDAEQKARTVLIDIGRENFIERIESDFVEVNGEKIKYQRDKPPYSVTFYEDYDAWLVITHLPSGIREDGISFGTPGMPPYVIMRGSDGKVLGIFH